MAYLTAGTGKSLSAETAEVYWDNLGDLPLEVLQVAARVALVEALYPGFPTIGQLRQIAARVQAGTVNQLPAIEAWKLVNDFCNKWALDDDGNWYSKRAYAALEYLPPLVRETARAVGWGPIYNSPGRETLRAQFCKAFEALVQSAQHGLLMPPPVQEALGRLALPKEIQGVIGTIGGVPE